MSESENHENGCNSYTFEVSPVDEAEQDRLNRLLRKPGDPPYDPTAKWLDPPKPTPARTESTSNANDARLSESTLQTPSGSDIICSLDAIPVDDDEQDRLNRLLRKPGDPPYDPTAKWLDPPKPAPAKSDPTSNANGKE
jgi:hypothetical protein